MTKKLIVNESGELLKYIVGEETGYSRTKLKSLLKNECISVNNIVTSQFNYPITDGDIIQIKAFNERFGLAFDIVYEDDKIIVIDKPSGLLSVPFPGESYLTAFDLVNDYISILNPNAIVHTVHRLDRETSGVLMFAKDKQTQVLYRENWSDLALDRVYIAYVEGSVSKGKDTIISNLNTDNPSLVFSSKEGKRAVTHYEVLERRNNISLLKVRIETGRQNQIRVHLKDIGHPIVGDKKYGAKTKTLKRLGLHAHQLIIKNPVDQKEQVFTASIPPEFRKWYLINLYLHLDVIHNK